MLDHSHTQQVQQQLTHAAALASFKLNIERLLPQLYPIIAQPSEAFGRLAHRLAASGSQPPVGAHESVVWTLPKEPLKRIRNKAIKGAGDLVGPHKMALT